MMPAVHQGPVKHAVVVLRQGDLWHGNLRTATPSFLDITDLLEFRNLLADFEGTLGTGDVEDRLSGCGLGDRGPPNDFSVLAKHPNLNLVQPGFKTVAIPNRYSVDFHRLPEINLPAGRRHVIDGVRDTPSSPIAVGVTIDGMRRNATMASRGLLGCLTQCGIFIATENLYLRKRKRPAVTR
ncbi:hypothetical protein CA13_73790 [Planctomycetes bacterium CA13]|uniref:Uncharacterized protein n=1 Tax=Novipirellula herctigrandis TaxID=2527986 RepID=A0A5C5YLS4_9BACT|nr:hypothetical protein CA13_73790 [Planctomycetes bacterium CA13]